MEPKGRMILSTMTAAVRRGAHAGMAGRALAARGVAVGGETAGSGALCGGCVSGSGWAPHGHTQAGLARVGAVRAFARSARSAPKLVSFSKQQRKKRGRWRARGVCVRARAARAARLLRCAAWGARLCVRPAQCL